MYLCLKNVEKNNYIFAALYEYTYSVLVYELQRYQNRENEWKIREYHA